MTLAFVLLAVRVGSERAVIKKVLEFEEVEDAHILFGEYDIILKVNAEDNNALQSFIVEKIRSMSDIEQSSTLISAETE
jgi:DNA-binding Lrp family transcriptional regulator